MVSDRICSWLANIVVCSLLLAAGCAPFGEEAAAPPVELEVPEVAPAEEVTEPRPEIKEQIPEIAAEVAPEEAATLALKFTPGDSTTYKVTTEMHRSVEWEGPLSDESIVKNGSKENRVEMTFTQQIQSTGDDGNAVAKITIEELKYLSTLKDDIILDFDSSRSKGPLAKLIGRGYTIEIAPTGEVTKVTDLERVRNAVRRGSAAPEAALALLKNNVIKERHGTLILPGSDKNQLRTGDNWSGVKTVSFGLMGPKSYEKVYTLKEIEDADGRQIAAVEMDTIPSSQDAEELYKQRAMPDFAKSFDNVGGYTGRLELDLTAGKVENYLEEMRSEWIVALPSSEQQGDEGPTVLKMCAIRLYHLEKID